MESIGSLFLIMKGRREIEEMWVRLENKKKKKEREKFGKYEPNFFSD